LEEIESYQKFQDKLHDHQKCCEKLMKSNEQLLKENQDPRQSDWTGTSNNQTRMVDVDKYNELLELKKVEKKRANRLERQTDEM
jgi:hypothetical protein